MDHLSLPDNAARQFIDACAVFGEHARTLQETRTHVAFQTMRVIFGPYKRCAPTG